MKFKETVEDGEYFRTSKFIYQIIIVIINCKTVCVKKIGSIKNNSWYY
jgi:hypothetical protein